MDCLTCLQLDVLSNTPRKGVVWHPPSRSPRRRSRSRGGPWVVRLGNLQDPDLDGLCRRANGHSSKLSCWGSDGADSSGVEASGGRADTPFQPLVWVSLRCLWFSVGFSPATRACTLRHTRYLAKDHGGCRRGSCAVWFGSSFGWFTHLMTSLGLQLICSWQLSCLQLQQ